MKPGMPNGKPLKVFQGVHARLVFLKKEDERAVLDLTRRFSGATRFAFQRLLEGKTREELKREDGPLCALFALNTRYADGAIEKARATLDSARELGQAPQKVVFGGRKLFDQLKRRHLSGKALFALKREWKERRQGLLYSRGDAAKKGNANLRLEPRDGALWLRVNLGNGAYVHALVRTSHPQMKTLLQRAYASLPYNVALQLKDGKLHAHFTWSEELPPPVHTKENGVLGVDVNGDPYHLALAVVSPDGNLKRHLTLSLEEVDQEAVSGQTVQLLPKPLVHINQEDPLHAYSLRPAFASAGSLPRVAHRRFPRPPQVRLARDSPGGPLRPRLGQGEAPAGAASHLHPEELPRPSDLAGGHPRPWVRDVVASRREAVRAVPAHGRGRGVLGHVGPGGFEDVVGVG